jgi:hypothetical protein
MQPEFVAMPRAAKKATARGANPGEEVSHLAEVTDRMHGLLMERADALMGCLEGSAEEAELAMLTDIHRGLRTSALAGGKNFGWQGLTTSREVIGACPFARASAFSL